MRIWFAGSTVETVVLEVATVWVAHLETKDLCTKVKGLVVLDEVIQSLRWPECCNSLVLLSCSRFFKVLDK